MARKIVIIYPGQIFHTVYVIPSRHVDNITDNETPPLPLYCSTYFKQYKFQKGSILTVKTCDRIFRSRLIRTITVEIFENSLMAILFVFDHRLVGWQLCFPSNSSTRSKRWIKSVNSSRHTILMKIKTLVAQNFFLIQKFSYKTLLKIKKN